MRNPSWLKRVDASQHWIALQRQRIKVLNLLVGQVMLKHNGKFNPQTVRQRMAARIDAD